VHARLLHLFAKFRELRSAKAVMRHFQEANFLGPVRPLDGPSQCRMSGSVWEVPSNGLPTAIGASVELSARVDVRGGPVRSALSVARQRSATAGPPSEPSARSLLRCRSGTNETHAFASPSPAVTYSERKFSSARGEICRASRPGAFGSGTLSCSINSI
jgi:hypothetical protein